MGTGRRPSEGTIENQDLPLAQVGLSQPRPREDKGKEKDGLSGGYRNLVYPHLRVVGWLIWPAACEFFPPLCKFM